jgi:hypothetical protein
MEDKVFAQGFSFKRNENAPQFVIGRLSLKEDEAIAFIKANSQNGWINLDIKKARTGNFYIELDTFVPTAKENPTKGKSATNTTKSTKKVQTMDDDDDGLPF